MRCGARVLVRRDGGLNGQIILVVVLAGASDGAPEGAFSTSSRLGSASGSGGARRISQARAHHQQSACDQVEGTRARLEDRA